MPKKKSKASKRKQTTPAAEVQITGKWFWQRDLRVSETSDRDDVWEAYGSADNRKIEIAFQKGQKTLKLNTEYQIVFNCEPMEQQRREDRTRRRFIKRVGDDDEEKDAATSDQGQGLEPPTKKAKSANDKGEDEGEDEEEQGEGEQVEPREEATTSTSDQGQDQEPPAEKVESAKEEGEKGEEAESAKEEQDQEPPAEKAESAKEEGEKGEEAESAKEEGEKGEDGEEGGETPRLVFATGAWSDVVVTGEEDGVHTYANGETGGPIIVKGSSFKCVACPEVCGEGVMSARWSQGVSLDGGPVVLAFKHIAQTGSGEEPSVSWGLSCASNLDRSKGGLSGSGAISEWEAGSYILLDANAGEGEEDGGGCDGGEVVAFSVKKSSGCVDVSVNGKRGQQVVEDWPAEGKELFPFVVVDMEGCEMESDCEEEEEEEEEEDGQEKQDLPVSGIYFEALDDEQTRAAVPDMCE